MNKRKIKNLEALKEYQSNTDYYNKQTAILVALQIPFLELVETQIKVNPNPLLKSLHFALQNWVNEPCYNSRNEEVVQQYTELTNLAFKVVEEVSNSLLMNE